MRKSSFIDAIFQIFFIPFFIPFFINFFYSLKKVFKGSWTRKRRGNRGRFYWSFKHGIGERRRGKEGEKREEKEEDFRRVFVWIIRAVSKNYFL